MRYTDQIKKYISITAASILSACMLFGCTRSDVASSSQNAAGTAGSGQGTVSSTAASDEQSLAGAGSVQTGQTTDTAQAEAADSSAVQDAAGKTAQNVSGTTTQTAQQPEQQASSQSAVSGDDAVNPDAEDDVQDVMDEMDDVDAEESFSGEYEKSDGGESVVISLLNDNQISFQFRTSGIGAVAEASGTTAVYSGDDGYTVTFDSAGDMLAVTVSGEGGEESAVNGIYYRVEDDGEDVDDTGLEDDDEDDMDDVDVEVMDSYDEDADDQYGEESEDIEYVE